MCSAHCLDRPVSFSCVCSARCAPLMHRERGCAEVCKWKGKRKFHLHLYFNCVSWPGQFCSVSDRASKKMRVGRRSPHAKTATSTCTTCAGRMRMAAVLWALVIEELSLWLMPDMCRIRVPPMDGLISVCSRWTAESSREMRSPRQHMRVCDHHSVMGCACCERSMNSGGCLNPKPRMAGAWAPRACPGSALT